MKKELIALALCGVFFSSFNLVFSQAGRGILPEGTAIPVKFSKKITSDYFEDVQARVASDVLDSEGNKLLAAETPVEVSLSRVASKSVGKGGRISIIAKSTRAIDGKVIDLSGVYHVNGKDRSGIAWILTGCGCFVIPPFNFLFLLMKGEAAEIPETTVIREFR